VLAVVQEMLLDSPAWLAAATGAMRVAIQEAARAVPKELQSAITRTGQIEREIANLLDALSSGSNSPAIRSRLASLEAEQAGLAQKRAELERIQSAEVEMPNDEWIRQQFNNLASLLQEQSPEAIRQVRSILGKITAEEVKITGKRRGYVRLHFRIDRRAALDHVLSKAIPGPLAALVNPPGLSAETGEEVVIDLGGPTRMDTWGPQILRWREDKVTWAEIARRTGLRSGNAYTAWRRWKNAEEAA
jgi:site-specific DNA recombinase